MANPNPGIVSSTGAQKNTAAQPSTPPAGANNGIGSAPPGGSGSGGSGNTITTTSAFGNWWDNLWAGIAAGATGIPALGALGGSFSWADLGAGLEAAFVAFLKDVFDLIVGPLEIIAGILLWLIALVLIFKDDITALAPVAIGALA